MSQILQYLFIAILCAKMSRVTWALMLIASSCFKIHLLCGLEFQKQLRGFELTYVISSKNDH